MTIFAQSWRLLLRRPSLLSPAIVVAVIFAAAAYVLARNHLLSWQFFGNLNAQGLGAFWLFFETIVALALRITGALVVMALTTVAAAKTWSAGLPLPGGSRTAWPLLGTLVLLCTLGMVAAVLVVPSFGLSVVVYLAFALYAVPAVLLGARGTTDAVLESMHIAAANLRTTFAAVLMVIAAAAAGGAAGSALGSASFAGALVSWLVMNAVVAYLTVAAVGIYLGARGISIGH